ncbi:MAG: ribosome small subunit-dependent GTPase A [Mariniphaga sp.]|nr:ribosome small subunit-dependent GTPase A [Mariniphaga sp.]
MLLEELGYNHELEQFRIDQNLKDFEVGRVVTEHKERYIVKTDENVYDSEVIGNLRFTAQDRSDFPAVGDWVAISVFDSSNAVIHKILPRKSVIQRQAVGKEGEIQIIATNVDYAFIVQAADMDFNINRLERYLAISASANVEPIIVLTKTDLIDVAELDSMLNQIKERIDIEFVFTVSNISKTGYEELIKVFIRGKTYCFLGSSGVGKSTLINNLSGQELMKTNSISSSTNKGRHITSHRELILLEKGGILIDNPGMREVGIADLEGSLDNVFDDIKQLSNQCRYANCEHVHEKGCAVLEALESGAINKSSYDNYLKLKKENEHFQSSVAEKRKKDKQFGKMVKDFKKHRNQNKF